LWFDRLTTNGAKSLSTNGAKRLSTNGAKRLSTNGTRGSARTGLEALQKEVYDAQHETGSLKMQMFFESILGKYAT
jgi:hypothetical protein